MNVLVTGATGFIGSHVTQQLISGGYNVKALVHSFDTQLSSRVLKVRGDILSFEDMCRAVKGCDIVIHCAAMVRLWHPDPEKIYNVNYKGTMNLLKAAKESSCKKFIYLSTAGVTGNTGEIPVDESAVAGSGIGGPYFRSKFLASESVVNAASDTLHVCVLYPGRVYGPAYTRRIPYLTRIIDEYRRGKWHFRHPAGNCLGSYAYVDDVAEGIIHSIDKSSNGGQYLLGGENATNATFFETLWFLTSTNPLLLDIPVSFLRAYAWMQEKRAMLTKSCIPKFTTEVVDRMFYHSAYDSSKAVDELNYKIRPLAQGIQDTLEYLSSKELVYAT